MTLYQKDELDKEISNCFQKSKKNITQLGIFLDLTVLSVYSFPLHQIF